MAAARKKIAFPLAVAARPVVPLPAAIAFYLAVLGAAIAWQAVRLDGAGALLRPPVDRAVPWWMAAIGVSWLLVLGPALVEARVRALRVVQAELYAAIAPCTPIRIAALAGLSGVAEEALFRGPLQATLGWPIAAAVFGALHGGLSRRLWPWTVFAVAAGALFGALVAWYDSLSPAIVAHITVNAINMRRLERTYGGGADA